MAAKKGKKKSTVNKAGNYTKPTMRKNLFNRIKAGSKGGRPGQWSARKAQMLAKKAEVLNIIKKTVLSLKVLVTKCLMENCIQIKHTLKQVLNFFTLKIFLKKLKKKLKSNGT